MAHLPIELFIKAKKIRIKNVRIRPKYIKRCQNTKIKLVPELDRKRAEIYFPDQGE